MPHIVTVQIDDSKIIVASNHSQNIKYSDLARSCENTLTNCKANFYIDDDYEGFITFNIVTGKILNLNLSIKIIISKSSDNIVRNVTIEQ